MTWMQQWRDRLKAAASASDETFNDIIARVGNEAEKAELIRYRGRYRHLYVDSDEDAVHESTLNSELQRNESSSSATSEESGPQDFSDLPCLPDRFQIQQVLGNGSFGSVWKAYDRVLKRYVAIKVPHRESAARFAPARFEREYQAAARLQHPHLVRVFEVGQHDGRGYIVNELIEGQSLSSWMKSHRPEPKEAARLLRDVAEAVSHAHEAGVIHRDLKPGNVLVDDNDRPYVADFGLARIEFADESMTAEGAILGTPAYMSPEQAAGRAHEADARSDVFSLGVMLYELTTGERPFHGSGRGLLQQVVEQEINFDRSMAKRIPLDLRTICLKCVRHNPVHRYPDAGQLADDLGRFLDCRPIVARPITPVGRLIRWVKRNLAVAVLGFLVIILLTSGVVTTSSLAIKWLNAAKDAGEKAIEAQNNADAATQSAEDSRRTLYHARMNQVFQAFSDGEFASAYQLVQAYQHSQPGAKHRGFEWYLAASRFCIQRLTLSHDAPVRCLLYSPDGRTLLTAGTDGRLSVWDTVSGERTKSLEITPLEVCCIDASPDWSQIAIGTGAGHSDPRAQVGKLHLLTFPDLREEQVITVDKTRAVIDLAFSPTGDRLLTAVGFLGWEDNQPGAGRGSLKIWDVSTGELVQSLAGMDSPIGVDPPSVTHAEFVSDSSVVSVMKPGQLNVWDVKHAKVMRTFNFGIIPGVALDSDRTSLAIAGKGVWDISNGFGEMHGEMGLGTDGKSLSFSADGWRLAVGNANGEVLMRDTETSEIVQRLTGHTGEVQAIAFSPTNTELATASVDSTVRIWQVNRAPTAMQTMQAAQGMTDIEFSSDGKLVGVALKEGSAKVWNMESGDVVFHDYGHVPEVCDIAFSPDNQLIATAGTNDESVKIWSLAGGDLLHEFRKTGKSEVDFSPDGRSFVHASGDRIQIRDTRANWQVSHDIAVGGNEVGPVSFSPDGSWLALGTLDPATVEIYEVDSWRRYHRITGLTGVAEIDFSPDGSELIVCQHRLQTTHDEPASIAVWNVQDRSQRGVLRGHQQVTWSADYSPDGRRIVSVGADGGVRVWDVQSLTEIVTLHHEDFPLPSKSVEFSPDGEVLAVGGTERLHFFDARAGYSRYSGAAPEGRNPGTSAKSRRLPPASVYDITPSEESPQEIELKLSYATDVLFTNRLAQTPRFATVESVAREVLTAEPQYLSSQPGYATLELGRGDDTMITVAIDEAEQGVHLYVDRNNNEDLTDDPPLSWQASAWPAALHMFVPVEVETTGKKHGYLVSLLQHRDSAKRPLGYFPNCAREGGFVLRNKPYRVFLYDQNGDGCYDDLAGTTLVMDGNGNSRFDPGSFEWLSGQQGIHIQGKQWRIKSCSADGSQLTLMRDDKAREFGTRRRIGFPVPSYEGKLLSGESHFFETVDRTLAAQIVLIWNGDPGSERMFPAFKLLAHRLRKHRVRFSTLSVCKDEAIARDRVARLDLDVPHLFDAFSGNQGRQIFVAGRLPHVCVLDRFGFLTYSGISLSEAEQSLQHLIRQSISEQSPN